jgi:hypothetical protein
MDNVDIGKFGARFWAVSCTCTCTCTCTCCKQLHGVAVCADKAGKRCAVAAGLRGADDLRAAR